MIPKEADQHSGRVMPDPQMAARNIHATAIILGDRGILVTGPSDAGKTTLALALIDHFSLRGQFSRLVGDDQLFVTGHSGRLVCRTPATIAGLAEIAGLGPKPTAFELGAVIDLCIVLVTASEMPRFQEEAGMCIAGCTVPRMLLAERNVTAAFPAVTAWLDAISRS
jgi:serine kinase of HPr protein (carbohydrate metabolism regulator)